MTTAYDISVHLPARRPAAATIDTSYSEHYVADVRKAKDHSRAECAGEWLATIVVAPFALLSRLAARPRTPDPR